MWNKQKICKYQVHVQVSLVVYIETLILNYTKILLKALRKNVLKAIITRFYDIICIIKKT